jgi:sec-independent protein translocase protein TatB
MFDISWGKILIVGIVALIFIKPQDLPDALRTLGQMVGKLRRMASDFQYQFSQAINESGVKDIQSTIDNTATFNPVSYARDQIKSAIDDFKPAEDVQGPLQLSQIPDPVIEPISSEPMPDLNILPPEPEKPKRKKKAAPEVEV